MSTPNFYNDEYFDLWVSDPDDEWTDDRCLQDAINYAEKELKRSPDFFEIELLGGHYAGIQLKVNENYYCKEYGNPIDQDNEGCKYQWDLCRSKAIRKFESEKKWINKKLLPMIAEYLGFRKLYCRGIFSNGEAVYGYAK